MKSKVPPLNALRVFEAAARHQSFSKAAQELHVTQGAVSKQIAVLESFLEQRLFERKSKGLALTEAGHSYLPNISQAMRLIEDASAGLIQEAGSRQLLNIDAIPSLSSLWLIPRLNALKASFPALDINLKMGDGPFSFEDSEADAAIRCLPMAKHYQNAELLCEEELVLVAHPALVSHNRLQQVSDIFEFPLLRHITRPQLWMQFWATYFSGESLPHPPRYGNGFEHFFLSLEAIRKQQGLGLLPRFLVKECLESGELINPLELSFASGYGYYLLVPKYRRSNSTLARLSEWLKQQLSGSV
ncbi:LysR substrate-binding domain-containing protein [Aliagarivorans taiwanensis]|uniref:LysR substrate-binding domain-containing protein n=1 Tax=Aliagarivorans taiwanensis TaxID=561966 RepID=UPI000409D97C|nr:LysR substrate-binding domain-containing protein [Aliagarivorans taiwanensis]